jgi:hypothetical protein
MLSIKTVLQMRGGPCFSNNENGGFVCLTVEDSTLRYEILKGSRRLKDLGVDGRILLNGPRINRIGVR